MSGVAAAWLHMEGPINLMVMNMVFWLDHPLGWDAVRKVVEEVCAGVTVDTPLTDDPEAIVAASAPSWTT